MRTAIAVALLTALLLPAAPAGAQYTTLALSAEPAHNCEFTDDAYVINHVYVLLTQSTGSLGVRFRVTQTFDCTLVYLQDLPDGIWVGGNVVDGLTVCFDECVSHPSTPRIVTTIEYFGLGTSAACSYLFIEPVPNETDIESVSCDGSVHAALGWDLPVNDDGTCTCYVASSEPAVKQKSPASTDGGNFCYVVSTRATTWGAIKGLYR